MDDLPPNLIQLIEKKARQECPDKTLDTVNRYIEELEQYIEGEALADDEEIKEKLEYIVGCTTITLDQPLAELKFLRARPCEQNRNFLCLDDLSYIKNTTEIFPKRGRLNKEGEALFYASIIVSGDKIDAALKTVLSEVNAKSATKFNILRSHSVEGQCLNFRILGIWYYISLNLNPFGFERSVFDFYCRVHNIMKANFNSRLFTAYQLTDWFLADIMSRRGNERLYKITSLAASIMLDGDHIDGILYQSTQSKEKPVVALKPITVDKKIKHISVTSLQVTKYYKYDFYEYDTISKAYINSEKNQLEFKRC